VVSEGQFARVTGYVKDGRESGANIAVGGDRVGNLGYFVAPTVFENTKPGDNCHNVFGASLRSRMAGRLQEVLAQGVGPADIRLAFVEPRSPEGEGVSRCAGIEETDLECVIGNGAVLPDELVEPLPGHDALAVGVDIGAMAVTRRRAVDRDAEANRITLARGAENEVKVARVEPVDDAAVFLIEHGALFADGPIP
jgi:hypothetical protein